MTNDVEFDNVKINGNLELYGASTIINQEVIIERRIECENFTRTDAELFQQMKDKIQKLEDKLSRTHLELENVIVFLKSLSYNELY